MDSIQSKKTPSFTWALFTFLIPVSVILYGIIGLEIRPPLLPLILAVVIAALMCLPLGYTWDELQKSMFDSLNRIQIAIAILILVGMIIAAWMASGTIPAIIYWGLKLIAPQHFMLSALVLCSIASLATGTSFGTMGTIGVALLGIGTTLGYSPAMTVGAIVSGAYLGDKMSPISDTCNIAASVCEVNLFRHISSMMWTTVPAFLFAAVLYTIIGANETASSADTSNINVILTGIENNFSLSPLVLLPPVVLFGLAMMRVPVLPTMMASLFISVVIIVWNGMPANEMAKLLTSGYVGKTSIPRLDKLLTAGGIMSSATTILLCYAGMSLGGILEKAKVLDVLIAAMLQGATSVLRLVLAALAAGYIILLGTGAQMLAIIIPGRAFHAAFKKADIDHRVLSRCCEDAGTLGSPLVPWSVPAFYILGVLGVSAYEFAPYAFLNWSVPIFSALCAITGFGIWRQDGTSIRRKHFAPMEDEHLTSMKSGRE